MSRGDQYKELVEAPSEILAIEYKSWLDLANNETRADLARHIAAIANHGGGMIVFGFNDDLTRAGANPYSVVNRDTISAVIKKYLEPTFHCDVEITKSEEGSAHPIVIIPSHGSVPICSKASGPQGAGKSNGIANATYYVRKPGPESAPVLTAAEWAPIIRRCALHERANILSAISVAISGGEAESKPNQAAELKNWHAAAFKQFQLGISKYGAPAILANRNVQFSYLIIQAEEQQLDLVDLRQIGLLQINSEVKDRVRTGWSMFYPFTRPEIAPRIRVKKFAVMRKQIRCYFFDLIRPNRLKYIRYGHVRQRPQITALKNSLLLGAANAF